jgi:hypothetical protein
VKTEKMGGNIEKGFGSTVAKLAGGVVVPSWI